LNVVPALRLAGEVRLSDGATPPAQTRVTVGFDDAWDSQYAELDPAGRFELHGLPPHAVVSLSTRVKGYRFSGKNSSLEPWNPFHLIGRLDENKTNLVILLEPGKDLEPGRDFSPEDQPKNRPLSGAEPPSGGSHLWWHAGMKPGDKLTLSFPAPKAGKYHVIGRFLRARDYGIHQLAINGAKATEIDFYNPDVKPSKEIDLGVFDLRQGENEFSSTVVRANPKAVPAYMLGLDYILLKAAD
jgi:hypothetical protein